MAAVLLATSGVVGAPPAEEAATSAWRTRGFEMAELSADELPWTSEPPLRLPARKPRDKFGVPLFRWHDGELYYRPGALAINGMKRIDAHRDTGDEAQLEQALKQARRLRKMSLQRRDSWWLPFWVD